MVQRSEDHQRRERSRHGIVLASDDGSAFRSDALDMETTRCGSNTKVQQEIRFVIESLARRNHCLFSGISRHDLVGASSFKHTEYRLPIVIQQFHTNLGDDVAMLVLFDLLQLVSKSGLLLRCSSISTAAALLRSAHLIRLHPVLC